MIWREALPSRQQQKRVREKQLQNNKMPSFDGGENSACKLQKMIENFKRLQQNRQLNSDLNFHSLAKYKAYKRTGLKNKFKENS